MVVVINKSHADMAKALVKDGHYFALEFRHNALFIGFSVCLAEYCLANKLKSTGWNLVCIHNMQHNNQGP